MNRSNAATCGLVMMMAAVAAGCGSNGAASSPAPDATPDQGGGEDAARGPDEGGADASVGPHDGGDASTSDSESAACDSGALSADEEVLVSLPADTWYTAHGTSFLGSGACIPVGGVEGCGAVINDWSGGVYDSVHNKMLIWGGGHDGYWGNELYSFDPVTFTWKRETTPSVVTASDQNTDPLADGNPVARHTYDHIAYITHANRLWSRGGSEATNGGSTMLTWTLDLDTQTWTNMAPSGSPF